MLARAPQGVDHAVCFELSVTQLIAVGQKATRDWMAMQLMGSSAPSPVRLHALPSHISSASPQRISTHANSERPGDVEAVAEERIEATSSLLSLACGERLQRSLRYGGLKNTLSIDRVVADY